MISRHSFAKWANSQKTVFKYKTYDQKCHFCFKLAAYEVKTEGNNYLKLAFAVKKDFLSH